MGEKLTRTGWANLWITIILLGAIGGFFFLPGCSPGQKDSKNAGVGHIVTWQAEESGRYWTNLAQFALPDGRMVTCLIIDHRSEIGLSCDWAAAKESDL